MTSWRERTLGEVVGLQRGYDLTADERSEGNVPVMGAAGHNGYHNEAKVSAPGIVVGRSGGSFGQVHFCETDFWPHNTAMFVTDFKGNDPYFVFYLLKLLNFDSLNSGSAQPSLNRNYLYPVKAMVPSRPADQVNVVSIIRKIDQKIALNNKTNAELEAMAKLIYDYWFIQFDFPDENGKPYKSSGGKMVWCERLKREIPEDWEVGKLGDWLDFQRGISYKKGEISQTGVPFINLDSFRLSGEFKPAGTKFYNGNFKELSLVPQQSLLIAITDVTRNADIIGRAFHLPDIFDQDVLISCDVARVIPETKELGFYLEMLFNSYHFHEYIKYFATGTLVLHLNLDGVRWFEDVKPPKALLEKFARVKRSVVEKRGNLIQQNQELVTLRDWLLPMLMNGQVTVGG